VRLEQPFLLKTVLKQRKRHTNVTKTRLFNFNYPRGNGAILPIKPGTESTKHKETVELANSETGIT